MASNQKVGLVKIDFWTLLDDKGSTFSKILRVRSDRICYQERH